MSLLYGLNSSSYHGFGGGHESGTPQSTTGARTPGTRSNGGETDDAVAGGPSWDQIFLKLVPALQTQGAAYANAICDARVDSFETSTQCLSYGYATRSMAAATGGTGGQVTENTPLLPTLSPLKLYQNLFSGIMPGGGTGSVSDMAKLLKARKSVLDYSMSELARMRTLAPGAEAASKIDVHTAAIRKIEIQLTTQINNGTMTPTTCTPPAMPDATLIGKTGSRSDYMATPTPAATDDSPNHELIGKAHMGILKAAFICDLIRVGTFQWSPGTNHVSFKGLFPNNPNAIYMHHPTSHIIVNGAETMSALPAAGLHQDVVNFLAGGADLVQPEDGRHPDRLEGDHRRLRRQPAGQHHHSLRHRGRRDHPQLEPVTGVHLRRQRARHEGRAIPQRLVADELVLADHRPGLLQEHQSARQPAGDKHRRHGEHVRAHRRRAHRRVVVRAVS